LESDPPAAVRPQARKKHAGQFVTTTPRCRQHDISSTRTRDAVIHTDVYIFILVRKYARGSGDGGSDKGAIALISRNAVQVIR